MDPETGRISPFWEIVAGGTAGGCQVVSTSRLVLPMGKNSGCCAGFHEPTGDRVRAIKLVPYAQCAHIKNTGKYDYKCRVKQPKLRVLHHEVHFISCANLDFWVYTVAHRRVCYETSHFQRYTFLHTLT
jgi:hypothetical protein